MLFNSFQFLVFFPAVTLLYFLLPHKFRWMLLLLASCIFYMAFIPEYILILFFTIIVDYFAGIFIENRQGTSRKRFLTLSIIANIGVLAFFKYYNFFTDNVNMLFEAFGIQREPLPYLDIILPIGLSFHTFQAMSYTIEVYRGNQKAERHFGIYSLYVMFYPQLVAGPIERPQNLLHQFREPHAFNWQNLLDGLRLMAWGLFKKAVIADRAAIYVNAVYANPEDYHYGNLILAAFFFSIQIYCDFSGYSDMAIGAARTMGYHLMTNFNRPYFATNIQEFWKKWHISLSTWFKDYLYISLGGNRKGTQRMYLNRAIVVLVSGLWHGANWTFVVWGALHAVFVVGYIMITKHAGIRLPSSFPLSIASTLFTFALVSLAWVFFRAENVSQAMLILNGILNGETPNSFMTVISNPDAGLEFGPASMVIAISSILFMLWIEYKTPSNLFKFNNIPLADSLFMALLITLIITLGVFYDNSFIYFQF